jgi:2,4-dienoyl-CoA reductase (NADPH2)
MDCSSGALIKTAKVPFAPGFQVPFAAAIRKETSIMTAAVGMITEPHQADEIITSGKADLVLLAREMLREPYWALKAQQALGEEPAWPVQYGYVLKRRAK